MDDKLLAGTMASRAASPPAGAPNPKFAHGCRDSDCELRVQKGHQSHKVAHESVPQVFANFGIGTRAVKTLDAMAPAKEERPCDPGLTPKPHGCWSQRIHLMLRSSEKGARRPRGECVRPFRRETPSVLRFRSSQTRVPQNDANFGIGTLGMIPKKPAAGLIRSGY